jgi:hypothetical protein
MMQKAAHKAALGEDTTEEDGVIEELNGEKNQMKTGYQENKGTGQGSKGSNGNGQGSQSGNGPGTN